MTFEILPALDLRGGNVVRLREGDFARETVYGDDPIATAQAFAAAGASWIHVVDLDGARGKPRQQAVIHAIVAAVADVRCQVAGGLRSPEAVTAIRLSPRDWSPITGPIASSALSTCATARRWGTAGGPGPPAGLPWMRSTCWPTPASSNSP